MAPMICGWVWTQIIVAGAVAAQSANRVPRKSASLNDAAGHGPHGAVEITMRCRSSAMNDSDRAGNPSFIQATLPARAIPPRGAGAPVRAPLRLGAWRKPKMQMA